MKNYVPFILIGIAIFVSGVMATNVFWVIKNEGDLKKKEAAYVEKHIDDSFKFRIIVGSTTYRVNQFTYDPEAHTLAFTQGDESFIVSGSYTIVLKAKP